MLFTAVAATAPAHAQVSAGLHTDGSADSSPLLEPTSDTALLNLLGEQGVEYYPVSDPLEAASYAGSRSTLVIDAYEHPDDQVLSRLTEAGFGRVVILDNEPAVFSAFVPGVHFNGYADSADRSARPACEQPDAVAAGSIRMTGSPAMFTLNAAGGSVEGCYFVNGFPTLAYSSNRANDVVALGSATFFENDELASAGDAALALRIFGAHPKLVWYAPSFEEDPSLSNCGGALCTGDQDQNTPAPGSTTTIPAGGGGSGSTGAQRPTVTDLMPSWIWWVLLQLLISVLLVAYWRGRRLGAVVTEQLPVAVRASETVEGHARLYRRANAHGRAAELLRAATAGRLAGYFGVPAARAHADPSLLVAPVAARLDVTENEVARLLAGDAPQSEADLVLLADHLDQLEQEVRSS
ncbi:hypothetical protein KGA66_03820 [Actinocrinis puniceicyclus]|uniref:DUF4350 domain-containing protein n=1 Tax=Actinocrinis puniceicyclus TaxID=977794 RepID=A0A8J7WLU5_9ACTN|nr:DUF4350 domain-containing protein [Actinocrinis puniceicyclus]MBS2962159.1 hypothetical protein [Actinocrinis puniceicyclus]